MHTLGSDKQKLILLVERQVDFSALPDLGVESESYFLDLGYLPALFSIYVDPFLKLLEPAIVKHTLKNNWLGVESDHYLLEDCPNTLLIVQDWA